MTTLEAALITMERRLIPSMDFLFLKKLTSFLNASMSNTVCSRDTIAVTARRYGFVSRSMFLMTSLPSSSSPVKASCLLQLSWVPVWSCHFHTCAHAGATAVGNEREC